MQGSRSEPCKRSSTEGSKFQPLQCICQEDKKDENRLKTGSVYDPARYQVANGGGDFNSPRTGPYNRDRTRTPCSFAPQTVATVSGERDPLREQRKRRKVIKSQKEESVIKGRTQGRLKKTAREGKLEPKKETGQGPKNL